MVAATSRCVSPPSAQKNRPSGNRPEVHASIPASSALVISLDTTSSLAARTWTQVQWNDVGFAHRPVCNTKDPPSAGPKCEWIVLAGFAELDLRPTTSRRISRASLSMKRPLSATLGTADELTATQARAMALAEIEAARAKRAAGPLFRDFADEFTRRQSRCWKPATRDSNRTALNNQILPFFGDMRLADIDRADVARWFDSLSATPAMPTARSRCSPSC